MVKLADGPARGRQGCLARRRPPTGSRDQAAAQATDTVRRGCGVGGAHGHVEEERVEVGERGGASSAPCGIASAEVPKHNS